MLDWSRRNPITAFLLIAFCVPMIGWTARGIVALDESRDGGAWDIVKVLLFYFGIGPLLAGFWMSYVEDGRAGITRLAKSMIEWRAPVSWWLLALLLPSLVAAVVVLTLANINRVDLGGFEPWRIWRFITPSILVIITIGPLAEEAGWRGYLLPRLMKTQSALTASLIIGLLWTFWHFPLSFSTSTYELFHSPTETLQYLIFVICLSVIMTTLFLHTRGSLLLVMMFHWAVNAKVPIVRGMFPDVSSDAWDQVSDLPLRFPAEVAVWVILSVFFAILLVRRQKPEPGKVS